MRIYQHIFIIRTNKPADLRLIITALQIVHPRLFIIVIPLKSVRVVLTKTCCQTACHPSVTSYLSDIIQSPTARYRSSINVITRIRFYTWKQKLPNIWYLQPLRFHIHIEMHPLRYFFFVKLKYFPHLSALHDIMSWIKFYVNSAFFYYPSNR